MQAGTLTSAEIENSLAIAIFTVGVDDPELVKILWKEKWTFNDWTKNLKEAKETKKVLKSKETKVGKREN